MAYEKTWHRDYAAESLKRAETSRWTQGAIQRCKQLSPKRWPPKGRRSMLAFGAPNGPANMKFNKPSE
ncbi:hypothetical protein L4W17_000810 [Pseudomonas aeruginosa]|nr:hypothetical protein [Pseudomonas aeruginosa]EKU9998117.1 hypothetical protein [Pseudomonas aeruginosa]EKV0009783.1 hypothetical protein [Pseudomonas aeruginosa]